MRIARRHLALGSLGLLAVVSGAFAAHASLSARHAAYAREQAAADRQLAEEELARRAAELEAVGQQAEAAERVRAAWTALERAGALGLLERVEEHAHDAGVEVEDVAAVSAESTAGSTLYRILGNGEATAVTAFLATLEQDVGLSILPRMRVAPAGGGALAFEVAVSVESPEGI